jgi:hypothetical protein
MQKFFGWLLIVIGALVAATAGLCSAMLLEPILKENKLHDAAGAFVTVGLFGGVPLVFGVACIIAGVILARGK